MGEVIDIHRGLQRERGPADQPEPLWREVLGRRLRTIREGRGDRLVDVAQRSGVSPQYLSEIERGRKEPSSEMIAAVSGALGVDLTRLLGGISADLRRPSAAPRPSQPTLLAA
ncbi:MAG: helix-turn-helix transcriptional regulator [Mycobacterium sp.]